MKKLTGMIIIAALLLSNTIPAYAWPEYSEETKRLGREAGLQMEDLEWEEIDRRQQEYRRRKGLSTSSNDELHIRSNGSANGSVAVTDTADGLHIYSNEYASQSQNYGSKNSYDEFHTAPKDIFDTDASRLTPHERCSLGVGRTWQIPRPFDKMSVADNVKTGAVHGAKIPMDKAQDAAEEALGIAGLMSKKDCPAGELTLLDRKKLELARALATKARLLLLDEVAAGLTEAEAGEVMDLVRTLKERKYTIIWIEHNIEVMLGAADRLMCMSEGRNVILDTPEKVMNSNIVEELYLGSEA